MDKPHRLRGGSSCHGLWIALGMAVAAVASAAPVLTLPPPATDRAGQVVTFTPAPDTAAEAVLVDNHGDAHAWQRDADGRGCFLVPRQQAGEALTFDLRATPPPSDTPPPLRGVEVRREPARLGVVVAGIPAFYYATDPEALPRSDIAPKFKRAGYLHPVLTPSGECVTDDFPSIHLHHHGLWASWAKSRFQGRTMDFWNMGDQTGTVDFVAVDRVWSGPVHGGFVARHRYVDLTAKPAPVTALNETWTVTAYDLGAGGPRARMFDIAMEQTCATSDPVEIAEYLYGGLGFRGRSNWNGAANLRVLTANGDTDRIKAHAKSTRWIAITGQAEHGDVTVAMLGDRENFRAPQSLRVHPNEPFICYTPAPLGAFTIGPGKPYRARYRLIIADGPPDAPLLEAFWQGFAAEDQEG